MKPVFKCDYCEFMGTDEEVKEHEPVCRDNYDLKNCYTCQHRGKLESAEGGCRYQCNKGKDIPVNCILQFCPEYEREEKKTDNISNIFGNIFNW